MGGFQKFLLRGNVVDLAVAFVLGGAFATVVTSFVGDILTPLLDLNRCAGFLDAGLDDPRRRRGTVRGYS